jgi:hypothetical protein
MNTMNKTFFGIAQSIQADLMFSNIIEEPLIYERYDFHAYAISMKRKNYTARINCDMNIIFLSSYASLWYGEDPDYAEIKFEYADPAFPGNMYKEIEHIQETYR